MQLGQILMDIERLRRLLKGAGRTEQERFRVGQARQWLREASGWLDKLDLTLEIEERDKEAVTP